MSCHGGLTHMIGLPEVQSGERHEPKAAWVNLSEARPPIAPNLSHQPCLVPPQARGADEAGCRRARGQDARAHLLRAGLI
eukprot:scaffold3472_cov136-Isochrysis_galbana.AAC.5